MWRRGQATSKCHLDDYRSLDRHRRICKPLGYGGTDDRLRSRDKQRSRACLKKVRAVFFWAPGHCTAWLARRWKWRCMLPGMCAEITARRGVFRGVSGQKWWLLLSGAKISKSLKKHLREFRIRKGLKIRDHVVRACINQKGGALRLGNSDAHHSG